MSKTYMIEVLITEPKGESLDDWGYIGKTFVDLENSGDKADYDDLINEIVKLVDAYEGRAES